MYYNNEECLWISHNGFSSGALLSSIVIIQIHAAL